MQRNTKRTVGIAALALVLLIGATAFVVFTFFPGIILDGLRLQYAAAAGVTEKRAVVDGYAMTYYEGGNGEDLVLIHGFGDSKISFLQAAKWLTPHYHVILPEVPGFGDTAHDEKLDYGAAAQAERFHALFHQIGLKKFHLGGNSMGGHITASYAIHYPEDLRSVILIDAAGMKIVEGEVYTDAEKPVSTPAEFDAYMDRVFVTKPSIPGSFKTYFIAKSQQDFAWQNRIRADLRKSPDSFLNDRVGSIHAPTLVLWGDKDRIIEPAAGDAYHAAIAGSQLVVFKDCGHSPQYERPKETAEAILAFLQHLPGPAAVAGK